MNFSPSFYRNLLEPAAFAELFRSHPPQGFLCADAKEIPVFHTDFDLLTTLEADARRTLSSLPFFAAWKKCLTFSTCFAGNTVTEYAPMPASLSPAACLDAVLSHDAGQSLLTIIKDLPDQSSLLPHEDNAFASDMAMLARKQGWIDVQGQALAYVPIDFASIEDYLARLSAGRRKDLRRKMKKRNLIDANILSLGDAAFFDQQFLDQLYAMYLEVFAQSEIHFDLLSKNFFAALLQSKNIDGRVFCYWHDGILAGYNICLLQDMALIDKYIGFSYPLARELNLYFVSWLVNLQFALDQGLTTYVAGWTDPEVKAALGAKFTFTRHLVWVRNPVLRRILYLLRRFFEADKKAIRVREDG